MADLKLHTADFITAVERMLATSRRERVDVMRGQMKSILRNVVAITPPGSEGVKAGTRAARAQGEASVARDIRRVYGSPQDAFALIEKTSAAQAAAFWKLHAQRKDEAAAVILRQVTGKGFSPFDGGKVHRNLINKRGKVSKAARDFVYAVRDSKPLDEYIKKIQARVHWLAAGWRRAVAEVGGTVPAMISKHDAPGSVELINDAVRCLLRANNEVKFASSVRDMERRVQWALDQQVRNLERQWERFQEQQARAAGMRAG